MESECKISGNVPAMMIYNDIVFQCKKFLARPLGPSLKESQQIRRITKAMHIPHQDFKESKIRALEGLK